MAAPSVSPTVTVNTTCDGLLFTDATVYTGSDITSSQVTTATIKLEYSTLGTYIQYVFTVVNNAITAATLSLAGATPVNIFSQLSTADKVFPQTSFDLTDTYTNITLPDAEDGVYYTTYTITGLDDGVPFTYIGTQQVLIECIACCCISKMFQELSADCACDDKKWMTAMRAASYLSASRYATQTGNVENAVAALNKATEICENGCGC